MSTLTFGKHRSLRRSIAITLIGAALVAPSVPVLGAVLDPDEPMVARATSEARRALSVVSVATTAPSSTSPTEVMAAEVVRLTNLERAAAGRAVLAVHPAVTQAAVTHSQDQVAMGRMSHTGSDGSDGGVRLTRAGFTWRAWGENVAVGQRTAQEVVTAWMGSAGHRANILSSSFTTIGVGVAIDASGRPYWTMVLAS
jgi:uncharacterized protein YkwD